MGRYPIFSEFFTSINYVVYTCVPGRREVIFHVIRNVIMSANELSTIVFVAVSRTKMGVKEKCGWERRADSTRARFCFSQLFRCNLHHEIRKYPTSSRIEIRKINVQTFRVRTPLWETNNARASRQELSCSDGIRVNTSLNWFLKRTSRRLTQMVCFNVCITIFPNKYRGTAYV